MLRPLDKIERILTWNPFLWTFFSRSELSPSLLRLGAKSESFTGFFGQKLFFLNIFLHRKIITLTLTDEVLHLLHICSCKYVHVDGGLPCPLSITGVSVREEQLLRTTLQLVAQPTSVIPASMPSTLPLSSEPPSPCCCCCCCSRKISPAG